MVTIEISRLQARRLIVVLKQIRDEYEQGELVLAHLCQEQPQARVGMKSSFHSYRETRECREVLDAVIDQLKETKEE